MKGSGGRRWLEEFSNTSEDGSGVFHRVFLCGMGPSVVDDIVRCGCVVGVAELWAARRVVGVIIDGV